MSETTATTLTPYLCCSNAVEAYAFYQKAFGAEPTGMTQMPDGKVLHAGLSINGAMVFLSDEFPEHNAIGPLSLGGSPVTLHLHVPDCDAVFQRAVEAGCTVRMPPADMFWGDRFGSLADPYGHQWSIATTLRTVSPEELQQAVATL